MKILRFSPPTAFEVFIVLLIFIVYSLCIVSLYQNKPQPTKISFVEQTASDIAAACATRGKNDQCYVEEFAKLIKTHSFDETVAVLHQLQKFDTTSRGCHLIAHVISSIETDKNLTDWKNLIAKMNPNDCTGGFVHGVFEEVATKDPHFTINGKMLTETCNYIKEKQGGTGEANCMHIMGHILLAQEGGSISKALAICQTIKPSSRYECFSGVYMENMTRDNIVSHKVGPKIPWNEETTQAQEELCKKSLGGPTDSTRACWREMAHMFAFLNSNNPEQVYKLCHQAPDRDAQTDCYLHAVGIMSVTSSFDPIHLGELCAPYKDSLQNYTHCIQWATGSLLTSSLSFIDRVSSLCSLAPTEFQKTCFNSVGLRLSLQVKDLSQLQQLCQKVPNEYRKYCLKPEQP